MKEWVTENFTISTITQDINIRLYGGVHHVEAFTIETINIGEFNKAVVSIDLAFSYLDVNVTSILQLKEISPL